MPVSNPVISTVLYSNLWVNSVGSSSSNWENFSSICSSLFSYPDLLTAITLLCDHFKGGVSFCQQHYNLLSYTPEDLNQKPGIIPLGAVRPAHLGGSASYFPDHHNKAVMCSETHLKIGASSHVVFRVVTNPQFT